MTRTKLWRSTGDEILHHCTDSKFAALSRRLPLHDAITQAILNKAEQTPPTCAIIAIDSTGLTSIQSIGRAFLTASSAPSSCEASVNITTISLLPQHIFHQDTLVSAGLTRYPITPGHTMATRHGDTDLMSWSLPEF